MLRRQARLRREFLNSKANEIKYKNANDKKALKKADAAAQQKAKQWKVRASDDENEQEDIDNEYRYAGCEDPKIVITTSHNPSSGLKMFAKEIRLIFPNAQKINRGKYEIKQLIKTCRSNDVTDFIMIHEHRGKPDTLIVCHLPFGPTAFFNISDVVMRHDVPDIGTVSQQKPHLIFHNLDSKVAQRTKNILKYLFPVPKEDSKRVITFANHKDYITFRHHTFQNNKGQIELLECGPRFQLKLFKIIQGTLDEINAADVEFSLRPYMNSMYKRLLMSNNDGWSAEQ